jgi:hypothetical protein
MMRRGRGRGRSRGRGRGERPFILQCGLVAMKGPKRVGIEEGVVSLGEGGRRPIFLRLFEKDSGEKMLFSGDKCRPIGRFTSIQEISDALVPSPSFPSPSPSPSLLSSLLDFFSLCSWLTCLLGSNRWRWDTRTTQRESTAEARGGRGSLGCRRKRRLVWRS